MKSIRIYGSFDSQVEKFRLTQVIRFLMFEAKSLRLVFSYFVLSCLVFQLKFSLVVTYAIVFCQFISSDGKNVATDMELANKGQSFT